MVIKMASPKAFLSPTNLLRPLVCMLFEILQAFLSVTLPSLNETLLNVDVLALHTAVNQFGWLTLPVFCPAKLD